jgi:sugar O-acyltransferase (sialic acid O-acetyltransferase NeuD family)
VKQNSVKTIVIGAAGSALNIIEQIIDARDNYGNKHELSGILIDSFEKGSLIAGIPVVGSLADTQDFIKIKDYYFLFTLYKPEKLEERYGLLQSLKIPHPRFTNFIHPLSYISASSTFGTGNVVLANSVIQNHAIVGDFNIINSNVTIEHDSQLGNGNYLAAGSCIGSNVKIKNHCFIGLNSTIRENVILGDNVFVGMHSAVLDNFKNVVIAGVPAKSLKGKQ